MQVPGLVGRPEADARRQLQELGLNVQVREDASPDARNGVVLAQDPPPGTQVPRGRNVAITVGRPQAAPKPQPKSKVPEQGARVPNVEGMDERQARRTLQEAGFRVDVEEETAADRKGQVVNQRPGAGDTVAPGVTVRIYIGS